QLVGERASEAPLDRLMHAVEVVRLVEVPDAQPAVVAALGAAAFERHDAGDGVLAHEVGDVEALDAPRRCLESEEALQLADAGSLTPALEQGDLGLDAGAGVAFGHSQELDLVAALRSPDRDLALRSASQEAFPHALIELGLRHQYQWRDLHGLAVVVGHEPLEDLGLAGAGGVGEEALISPDDASETHLEE